MNRLTMSELREIAKSKGLRGYSRLRKAELISFIKDNENRSSDRATEVAIRVGKKTIKELKDIARIHGVKIRSGANKSEIIYLLGENYGERRIAAYEKKYGLWNSDIRADEESKRWDGVGKSTRRNVGDNPQNQRDQHLGEDSEADSRRCGS